ncbi:MAG: hypothetical protein V3U49_03990 [Nitrososphaerales archaeon]
MTTAEPSELRIMALIMTSIIATIALSIAMNNLAIGTGLGVGIFLLSVTIVVRNHRKRLVGLDVIHD